MLEKTGVVSLETVEKNLPSEERRKKGPYVVIECFQRIPCNPCYTACKVGAVREFEDINDLPEVDYEKCTGCGLCVSSCPGLACFVIDETFSEDKALIKLPYELLPLPEVGDVLDALDREGNIVGKAEVVKVQSGKKLDCTSVISISVPKEQCMIVRNIKLGGSLNE
jgi:Fe-S-cluster-containing hydrogenase component 2